MRHSSDAPARRPERPGPEAVLRRVCVHGDEVWAAVGPEFLALDPQRRDAVLRRALAEHAPRRLLVLHRDGPKATLVGTFSEVAGMQLVDR